MNGIPSRMFPTFKYVCYFKIQTGDPTGTGTGGKSIWGRPFKDEFHGRIKFNHRGQVAMANENKPHTNQSQFFITLASCEWIDRKHTIFGKVTGNTIFNVLRMGEVDVDDKDGPVDPIKIVSIEVLWLVSCNKSISAHISLQCLPPPFVGILSMISYPGTYRSSRIRAKIPRSSRRKRRP